MFYRRFLTVITHPRSSRNFSTSSIGPAPIIRINYLLMGLTYKDRPIISTIKQPSGDSVQDFLNACIHKHLGTDCPPGRLQGYRVDIPLSRGRMDTAFTPEESCTDEIHMEHVLGLEHYFGGEFTKPDEEKVQVLVKLSEVQASPKSTPHVASAYPLESEEGRDSLMAISESRLEKVYHHLEGNHISLLRSPPYTGKSTFGQALRDYFLGLNHQAIYINLAGMDIGKTHSNKELFQDYWRSIVGRTWDEIIKCTTPTYVFIDEAQMIYGDAAPYFWGSLKQLLSVSKRTDSLRVLMLASYDPTMSSQMTPIQFTNTLGLETLRLTSDEFQQITTAFVKRRHAQGNQFFTIPPLVQEAILNLSGGHAGLCRITLKKIWEKFCRGGSDIEILEYLVSSNFRRALQSTRAFIWMEDWNPTVKESQFIRSAFLSCDSKSICKIEWDTDPVAKAFFKSGLLTQIEGRLQFTAPIMRITLGLRLFSKDHSSQLHTTNFEEFMLRTIERMRPSILKNSLGRETDYLLERTWQFEWYRAAMTAVPPEAVVSPDVGAVFGSPGYLDFYVNGDYAWGIELLCEGNRAKHHADRFERGGVYEKIPMKEHVLLDFRNSANVGELLPNFWYAIYSDDYRQITLRRLGQADETIILHGDVQ